MPPDIYSLLSEERLRQGCQGYDAAHDDALTEGQLARAAVCFIDTAFVQVRSGARVPVEFSHPDWPFPVCAVDFSGPPLRNLVKGCALAMAEIERLQRIPAHTTHAPPHPGHS